MVEVGGISENCIGLEEVSARSGRDERHRGKRGQMKHITRRREYPAILPLTMHHDPCT